MKYKFVTAIHYLELEKSDSKIELSSGYISNKSSVLDELFENSLSLCTIGLHSLDDIRNAPSFYLIEGDFGDEVAPDVVAKFGTSFCFGFLRQIQIFVSQLWRIKDNSIYVRDGFLYTYTKDVTDGCTFKASVSAINTLSSGEIRNIIIPTADLLRIGADMTIISHEDVINQIQDFKSATQIQHFKESGLNRKDLAKTYVNLARMEATIPIKILMYCSAIEALVANSTTELSHRVAERVATMLGSDQKEKCEIYSTVKNGYDARSKFAHGDFIKKDVEQVKKWSITLDEYLRQLLKFDHPYNLSSKDFEEFFLMELMK